MWCLRWIVVVVSLSIVGCGTSKLQRPLGQTYHAFETLRGKEVIVTHEGSSRYVFLDQNYFASEKGGEWRKVSAEKAREVRALRLKLPVIVGNNGFLCYGETALARLGNKIALATGAAVAIESTPAIERTIARAQIAKEEGLIAFWIAYSAGCRDIVEGMFKFPHNHKYVFVVDPTYQSTIGYKRLPGGIEKFVCFRIHGGNFWTFSGRKYEPRDFTELPREWENVTLATRSHVRACEDPAVFARIVSEIYQINEKSSPNSDSLLVMGN